MRQFIAENFPDARGILCLSGKAYRYFRQVLRVKNGDMVAVRMPDGTLQNMTVCQIDEVSSASTFFRPPCIFRASSSVRCVSTGPVWGTGTKIYCKIFVAKIGEIRNIIYFCHGIYAT